MSILVHKSSREAPWQWGSRRFVGERASGFLRCLITYRPRSASSLLILLRAIVMCSVRRCGYKYRYDGFYCVAPVAVSVSKM